MTVSVLMRFDPHETMLDHRITRSVIKSAKRFTYKEAKKVLDGEKTNPHSPLLALMVELLHAAQKESAMKEGALNSPSPNSSSMIDEKGMPYKTDYITYDVTHQMVEEFMLKANETGRPGSDAASKKTSLSASMTNPPKKIYVISLFWLPHSVLKSPTAPRRKICKSSLKKQVRLLMPTILPLATSAGCASQPTLRKTLAITA